MSGRSGRRAAAFAAAVVVTLLALPGAARADDSLTSADPAPGAVLSENPGVVALHFASKVSGDDSHIAVSTAAGDEVVAGETEQPAPDELRVTLVATAPGDLTVAYHVIFLDGGSVSGAYRFSAGTGVAPAPLSAAARQIATSAVANHVHQVDSASAVLLVIDGAVALIVLFLLWARPRPGRRAGATPWRYRED